MKTRKDLRRIRKSCRVLSRVGVGTLGRGLEARVEGRRDGLYQDGAVYFFPSGEFEVEVDAKGVISDLGGESERERGAEG